MKNVEDFYPLSPLQQGILFHSLAAPGSGVYMVQLNFELQGDLDPAALESAWQMLMRRHQVLRTSFKGEGLKTPVQVVHREVDLPIAQHDWRTLSDSERKQKFAERLKADALRGFDLSTAPLTRVNVFRTGEQAYQLNWTFHHIILDGWSSAFLVRELFACYEAYIQGLEPQLADAHPYREYISWLHKQDQGRADAFWKQQLAGFSAPTPLGVDRPLNGTYRPKEESKDQLLVLPHDLSDGVRQLARNNRVTLNTVIQGAWALLLSRYSGESDVTFGFTVSGRPPDLAGVQTMVGLFINTLPARVQVPANALLNEWLKGLQEQQLEIGEYEYSSLVDVQRSSGVPRGRPLFETILVFENYPVDGALQKHKSSLQVSRWGLAEGGTGYPLTLLVAPGSQVPLRLRYQPHRFDDDKISSLLAHLQNILAEMVARPQRRLADIQLLTLGERKLLSKWNDTVRAIPDDCCAHHLFERQARQTPDAVALVVEEKQVTYAELNQRADRLAQRLRQLGVGPEITVGVCLERSLEMVVAILAVLKAGGAYVPLDPSYPSARLEFMLYDSGAPVLLTQKKIIEDSRLSIDNLQLDVVCLDSDWDRVRRTNPTEEANPENLAYVIYTSGSTGQPKGVAITHRSLVNFLASMREKPGLDQEDVLVAVTTLSFDIAALELFLPLTSGARAVLASTQVASDGRELGALIERCRASVVQATPATWRLVLESDWPIPRALRILSGGEALTRELANQLRPKGAALWNLYGPTETTIWSTIYKVEDGEGPVSIGQPIANTQVHILDSNLIQVPIGVRGELHIGGAGLARGYFNRPELTAESFKPDPVSKQPGSCVYKSGDVAFYQYGGQIECLGRLDHQVKVRGFRIELGEIESVCARHSAIDDAVVVARQDGDAATAKLVAYLVSDAESQPTVGELRQFFRESLPDYMVPSSFVFLERLPRTPNGKVDRRALPAPDQSRPDLTEAFIAPRSAADRVLADIWAKVLGVEEVGLQDNFFELGGHSLMAMQVISRVRKIFGVDVPLRILFEEPTVTALSRDLIARGNGQIERVAAAMEKINAMSPEEKKQLLKRNRGGQAPG